MLNLRSFYPLICSILTLINCVDINAQSSCQQSKQVVRILTYNILHGATTKKDFDLDLLADVIKSANPDIVALQEVDRLTNRAHGMDLVTELALRTKMAPLFGKAMPYDGGEYGEGILSRFLFLSTQNHQLRFSPGHEPRAALQATITIPSGDTIVFVGTHLDHEKNECDRLKQANDLNNLFRDSPYPTILAGDLNALPKSETIQILKQVWFPCSTDKAEATWPSDNPTRKLDYIMFMPKNRWRVIETKVIDQRVASDHRPLLVVLELLPQ